MDAIGASNALDFEWVRDDGDAGDASLNIPKIVRRFDQLPDHARLAPITQIIERKLNRALLSTILNQPASDHARNWPARIEKRRQRITPYLGRTLICVFIRLPGVHFTLEIDPESETVIHWEWDVG